MSAPITEPPLPGTALLQRFVDSGDYTDCFRVRIDTSVTFPAYVEAFYTTAVFKAERFILTWLVSRPSTDSEARALANNEIQNFAAWKMLDRADNQLLMMDFRGNTCSWLMLEPGEGGSNLYFGSAIIRNRKTSSGRRMGWTFRALLGFHRLYSRILLRAARNRLLATAD
ncbi:MAG: hypothetical protein ACR2QR_11230 [Woeseiaceae bacterium]